MIGSKRRRIASSPVSRVRKRKCTRLEEDDDDDDQGEHPCRSYFIIPDDDNSHIDILDINSTVSGGVVDLECEIDMEDFQSLCVRDDIGDAPPKESVEYRENRSNRHG